MRWPPREKLDVVSRMKIASTVISTAPGCLDQLLRLSLICRLVAIVDEADDGWFICKLTGGFLEARSLVKREARRGERLHPCLQDASSPATPCQEASDPHTDGGREGGPAR